MPTIAEPVTAPPPFPARGTVLASELAEALRLDLADRGVKPTPLNVIALATEQGLPEAVAVQMAQLLQPEEPMLAAA